MASKTIEVKGGARFAATMRDLTAKLGPRGALNVGFLEGAKYPATASTPGLPVAQVAFWNEFGTKNAPARPFFRNAIEANSKKWPAQLAAAVKASRYDSRKALGLMGTIVKDQIVKSIVDTTSPPLARSTVARKGFDKPLVDTGVMQRSVDFEIKG